MAGSMSDFRTLAVNFYQRPDHIREVVFNYPFKHHEPIHVGDTFVLTVKEIRREVVER